MHSTGNTQATALCALVDWGTTSFRLWLVDSHGTVLAERRSHEGMMHCNTAGFAQVLEQHLQQVGARADLPVLICGMAGAKQGWVEAPYINLPARFDQAAAHAIKVDAGIRDVRILAGLAQNNPQSPDVMRGEETQLAGIAHAMALQNNQAGGMICMPGTHSKWAQLQNGVLTQFSTFMTGEIFSLLSKQSILQHAVDEQSVFTADNPAFVSAVDKMLNNPARLLDSVFNIRAGQLLGFEQRSDGLAHLSGLLIGAEIGAARQIYGAGEVGLVASGTISALYQAVLGKAGYSITFYNGEVAVRQGLLTAALALWGQC